MTFPLLTSDSSRFHPVDPNDLVLARLAQQASAGSLKQLATGLAKLAPADVVDRAVATLVTRGHVRLEAKIELTPAGRAAASAVLGLDEKTPWKKHNGRRFALIALGLDPDTADMRKRFAKAEAVKAATVAVAYGLPAASTVKAVVGELVWRLLRDRLGDVVGKGPFPALVKPGLVERTLINGLAGAKATSLPNAFSALAARTLGLDNADADAVIARLIRIGLERAATSGNSTKPAGQNGVGRHETTREPVRQSPTFVDQVRKVAAGLSTPPFQGRVAIAQVYDAYGKKHSDAGSLTSFKDRLVTAAQQRAIQLGRLDLPERMPKELRERSETPYGTDQVHFIITEWK